MTEQNVSTDLGDDHVSAFFHEGDAGTYQGGPTLAPTAFDELEDAEADRAPSPEQLARRERFTRLVVKFVGTLGAASLLLFAFRAGRGQPVDEAPASAVQAVATETTVAVAAKVPEPTTPVVAPSPSPEPVAIAAPLPAPPPPEPEVQPAEAPVVTLAPKLAAEPAREVPKAAPSPTSPVASAHQAPRVERRPSSAPEAAKAVPHVAPLRPAVVSAPVHSVTASHAPPTANFPD